MNRITGCIFATLLLTASTLSAEEPPPYMQIKPGQSAEIKGVHQKDGVFRAEEIELLPDSRRPKLRGLIDSSDAENHTITLFGQPITVTRETQFLDVPDGTVDFSLLKPKTRAEVSCKVDSTGRWFARHIRLQGVKGSDKIKGTITRVAFDGHPPDTLNMENLIILVTTKTEVFRTLGGAAPSEEGDSAASGSGSTTKP